LTVIVSSTAAPGVLRATPTVAPTSKPGTATPISPPMTPAMPVPVKTSAAVPLRMPLPSTVRLTLDKASRVILTVVFFRVTWSK
jgi:hypothetical protein